MISVYKLKSGFRKLLTPVMVGLHRAGISPNTITISAIVLSAAMGAAFMYSEQYPVLYLTIALGFLVRMALNALDGLMAGTYNLQSKLGEALNELGDVVSDAFIYLGFLFIPNVTPTWVAVFTVLAVINEMAGVLGKILSGIRRYDGPMGKSDRALVVGLLCIGLYFYPPTAKYVDYVLICCILLMVVSTVVRIQKSI